MRWCLVPLVYSFSLTAWGQTGTRLPIELNFNAPPDCGDSEAVLRAVEAMLADTVAEPDRQSIYAEVTLRPTASGKVEIEFDTRMGEHTGERRLIVADCAEATRATALLLALLVNPDARATSDEPERSTGGLPMAPARGSSDTGAPPLPAASSETARSKGLDRPKSPEPIPESTVHHPPDSGWLLGITSAADFGNLPKPGIGIALNVGIRGGPFRLELRPAAWWPTETTSPQLTTAGGRFRLLDVAVLGCFEALQYGRVIGDLCFGVDALRLSARGFGASESNSASSVYFAALTETGMNLELGRAWVLRIGADGMVAPQRDEFAIRNLGIVHRPAAWSGRLWAGPRWQF